MGEPDNALKVYMNRPDRIRSVLEYYLGEKRLQYTLNPESGEEEADMCKALEDIRKDAMKKGVKQGERRGTLMTLFSLVNDGLLQLGEAARRANLSESAFSSEMQKAGF